MIRDADHCVLCVGQGKQVVEERAFMRGPREVLGKACRVQPIAQRFQPREVVAIKRAFVANAQANTVNRNGEAFGEMA